MGYLTKSVLNLKRKKPTNLTESLGKLEHTVQLKRIEIENYKRCYTNITWQPKEKQERYHAYLEKLEGELRELEQTLSLHPEAGAL